MSRPGSAARVLVDHDVGGLVVTEGERPTDIIPIGDLVKACRVVAGGGELPTSALYPGCRLIR